MRHLIIGFGLLFFGISSQVIHAQELYYLLITDQDRSPIPGAIAKVNNQNYIADYQGIIILPSSKSNEDLNISSMGFLEKSIHIQSLSLSDTIHIILEPNRHSLDQIEISGHRLSENTLSIVEVMDQDQLNKKSGLTLGSVIENVTGVNLLKTGSTIEKPMIHGLHSNRLAIINSNVKQRGQEWGAEHAPEIDPYAAGSIKVIKGAESVKYGSEAMGGAILIEAPELKMDTTLYGSFRLSAHSNGLGISSALRLGGHPKKLPNFAWMIQGSAKRSGNLNTPDYYLENSGVKEWNGHAHLKYTRPHFESNLQYSLFSSELGILTSSHIGSIEDLNYHIKQGRPSEKGVFTYDITVPKQNIHHHLLKWNNHIHLSDYAHITAQYSFQWNKREEYDIRRGGRSSIPSIDLSLKAHDFNVQLNWTPHRNLEFDMGVFYAYQDNENIPGTFTTPLIPDYIQNQMGMYALATWNYQKWNIQTGARIDKTKVNALGYNYLGNLYGEKRNYEHVSGSIGAEYQWTSSINTSYVIANAWRSPHVNELYSTGLHHGTAAFELGDEHLNPESSIKNMISTQWKTKWPISFEIELYSHLFNNYIYLNPTQEYWESLRGVFPIFQYEQTKAHLYGIDFLGTWKVIIPLEYQFQTSLIKAKNLETGGFLPQIPAHQLRHSLNWTTDRLIQNTPIYIKLEHVWVGHQYDYSEGLDFVAPPDAYHLINASLGTQFHFKKQKINIDLTIQNLTNQLYKDYLNRLRYYTHDLGRSIQIRLNYEF